MSAESASLSDQPVHERIKEADEPLVVYKDMHTEDYAPKDQQEQQNVKEQQNAKEQYPNVQYHLDNAIIAKAKEYSWSVAEACRDNNPDIISFLIHYCNAPYNLHECLKVSSYPCTRWFLEQANGTVVFYPVTMIRLLCDIISSDTGTCLEKEYEQGVNRYAKVIYLLNYVNNADQVNLFPQDTQDIVNNTMIKAAQLSCQYFRRIIKLRAYKQHIMFRALQYAMAHIPADVNMHPKCPDPILRLKTEFSYPVYCVAAVSMISVAHQIKTKGCDVLLERGVNLIYPADASYHMHYMKDRRNNRDYAMISNENLLSMNLEPYRQSDPCYKYLCLLVKEKRADVLEKLLQHPYYSGLLHKIFTLPQSREECDCRLCRENLLFPDPDATVNRAVTALYDLALQGTNPLNEARTVATLNVLKRHYLESEYQCTLEYRKLINTILFLQTSLYITETIGVVTIKKIRAQGLLEKPSGTYPGLQLQLQRDIRKFQTIHNEDQNRYVSDLIRTMDRNERDLIPDEEVLRNYLTLIHNACFNIVMEAWYV